MVGETLPLDSTTSLTYTVLNTDTVKTKSFRIYLKWDDENGTMDNQADTAATVPINAEALLNVSISFTQKAN